MRKKRLTPYIPGESLDLSTQQHQIEDLLGRHQETLLASHDEWAQIAQTPISLNEPGQSEQNIADTLTEIYQESGSPFSDEQIELEAARQKSQTEGLLMVVARYMSGVDPTDREEVYSLKNSVVFDFADEYYQQLFDKCIDQRTFKEQVLNIAEDMSEVDAIGSTVLDDLIKSYGSDPAKFTDFLKDLSEYDNHEYNLYKTELSKIISVDWRYPAQSNSQLKKYVQQLKDNPELLINSFAHKVETDKKYHKICTMAKFAIDFAVQAKVPSSVSEVLSSTYRQWCNYEDIQKAFDNHVNDTIIQFEQAIKNLTTNLGNSKNIRFCIYPDDILQYRNKMFIRLGSNRGERRSMDKKFGNGAAKSDLGIGVPAETVTPEETLEPREARLLKKAIGGYRIEKKSVDEILESLLPRQNHNGLRGSICNAIEVLLKNPFSEATSPLVGQKISLKYPKRRCKARLMHLRLNRLTDCNIDSNYIYWRIVYAIDKSGDVAILSITDHDEFDKIY